MRQILRGTSFFFLLITLTFFSGGRCYAVVPASTSLEGEASENDVQRRISEIIEKLEQRREEDIQFLESIKSELKGVKS